ncbi:hypothetical protein WL012_24080, partial [Vibrio alginolyticus]
HLTKHLRVIPNAWHFSFHRLVRVYGGKVKFRGRVTHTLMRRYVLGGLWKTSKLAESTQS